MEIFRVWSTLFKSIKELTMANNTLLIISRIWHFCQVFGGKTFKKVCLVQCIKFNNLEQTEDLPKTLLHGRKTFSISVRHRRLSFLTHISFNGNFKFFWSYRLTSIFIKKWYPMLLNLKSSDQWEFSERIDWSAISFQFDCNCLNG